MYVVTLSDTFPLKRVAFTYLHTAVFENVLCEGQTYNLIHCSSQHRSELGRRGYRDGGVNGREEETYLRRYERNIPRLVFPHYPTSVLNNYNTYVNFCVISCSKFKWCL